MRSIWHRRKSGDSSIPPSIEANSVSRWLAWTSRAGYSGTVGIPAAYRLSRGAGFDWTCGPASLVAVYKTLANPDWRSPPSIQRSRGPFRHLSQKNEPIIA